MLLIASDIGNGLVFGALCSADMWNETCFRPS